MSTETIGEKLREENELPLRKVVAMDVTILSKMERGERKLTGGSE